MGLWMLSFGDACIIVYVTWLERIGQRDTAERSSFAATRTKTDNHARAIKNFNVTMIIVYTFAEEDGVIFVKSYPFLRESWEASRSTWQDRSSRMQKRNSPTLWDIKPRILYPLRSLQSCPPSPRDASPIPISLLDLAMSRSSFPIRTAETLDQGGSFPSTVPVSRCYREISLFLLTAVCSKQYRGQRCRLSSFLHASFVNVSSYARCNCDTKTNDPWYLNFHPCSIEKLFFVSSN